MSSPSLPLDVVVVEPFPAGGLFQFGAQLASGLVDRGHRVDLLTGRNPEISVERPGLVMHATLPTWRPGAERREPRLYRKARRLVRGVRYGVAWLVVVRHVAVRQPDVVLWSGWRFPLDGWCMWMLVRLAPLPVRALVAHEPRPLGEQRGAGVYKGGFLLQRSLASAFASLDVIFVLGPSAEAELRTSWPIAGTVTELPHGDYGVLAGVPTRMASAAPPRILFFGTLTRYKGLDVLLEAFADVRRRCPDAELLIVGAESDDLDLELLRTRAQQIGNVVLRPGYVSLDDVPQLFDQARVVALPYHRASQSGVAHLAHTLGRPVVATDVGDLASAVADGGLLIPAGDHEALAHALVSLLEDPERAERLGEAGRRRLERAQPWAVAAERVETAVTKAVRRKAASPTRVTVHRLDDTEVARTWLALQTHGGVTSPFLCWEWVGSLAEDPLIGPAVRVLIAWQQDTPIGLVALQRVRRGRLWEVGFPGTGWMGADHIDVVGRPDLRRTAAEAICRRVASDRSWSVADLDGLARDGALAAAVDSVLGASRVIRLRVEDVPCPYVSLTPAGDQQLIASKKLRYQVRKGLRDAEEAGGGVEIAEGPDRVVALLAELMDLHRARFGDKSAVFATKDRRATQLRAARSMAVGGAARMYRLHDGEQSIALIYVLRRGDRLHHYATAFRDIGQSPGVVTLGHAIGHAASEGITELDLLRGDHEWKLRFATGVRENQRVRLVRPRPVTTVVYASKALSRAARRISAALPESW